MIFPKLFLRIDFFKLQHIILFFLLLFPKYSHQEIQLAQSRDIWGSYNLVPNNQVVIDTISKQLDFYQALGYTHMCYPFKAGNYRRVRCNPNGDWEWLNGRYQEYLNSFCSIYDSLKFHNLEVIPFLYPNISHSSELISMIPQMSSVPTITKLLYLKTSSVGHTSANLKIKVSKSTGTCVYIAYDHSISASLHPNWLKNNFIRLNTSFKKNSPDYDFPDNIVTMMAQINSNDTIRYDLYQSKPELASAVSLELGRNSLSNTAGNMYLVLFGPYNYSPVLNPDAGFINPGSIIIDTVIDSDNWRNIYRLDTIQYSLISEDEYLYGDSPSDFKLIKGQNFCDVSGILSFNPYIRNLVSNSVLQDGCTAIDNPVIYNHVLNPNVNNSFSSIRIYNLYALYLGLLKNAYERIYNKYVTEGYADITPFPKIIGIAHDELGYSQQGLVFPASGKTAAQLVAEEIKVKIRQIDSVFGDDKKIRVLIFGDSFVKNDFGEEYNLAGDTDENLPDNLYGQGGVLWILKNEYNLYERIILAPWRYSHKDGYDVYNANKLGGRLVHNKYEQIRYLDKLGIKFIPCMGEDHGRKTNNIDNYIQCSWEWMRAGEAFPKHRVGYAHFNYASWRESNTEPYNDVKFGQLISILPYLKKYSYLVKAYGDKKAEYKSILLSGLDYKKARDSISLSEGVHYTLGLGLADLGNSTFTHGGWNSELTNYEINGYDSGNGMCFAYTNGRNFEFATKVNNPGNSDYSGILVRNNLKKEFNKSPFVHLFHSNNSNRIYIEYCDSSGYTTRDNVYTDGQNLFLKVQKYGKNLRLYCSTDGVKYTLLKTFSITPNDVFVGLASRDSRTDLHSVNATFYNISFKTYDQQPAVNLMLNNF